MRRVTQYVSLWAGLCLAFGLTACSDDDSVGPCGNGVVDTAEGEVCDGADLGGATCSSLGYSSGDLACTDECTYDESGCNDDCGNGVVDGSEECDGDDLDDETCESRTGDPGTLTCRANCTFDISDCGGGVCGNGQIEGSEECDLFELDGTTCADLGFAGGDLACTVGCSFNTVDCYNEAVMDVGSACDENVDCNGGTCLTEVAEDRHWGPAGGYCYENCDMNGNCPLSGADGVCVDFTSGAQYCMEGCDLAAPACRPGYECTDVGGVGVCFWGACTDDNQCVVTNDCDTDVGSDNEGWCITPEEDCTNGTDDDFDGKADCSDSECTGSDLCPLGEICGNTTDDDGDGYADCDDAECGTLAMCTGWECVPPTGADLSCGDTLTGEANNGTGSTDVIEGADCVSPDLSAGGYFRNEWGPEYAYTFSVTQSQLVTITVSNYTGDLDIYILKEYLGTCDPGNGCFAYGGEGAGVDEVITFAAHPGINYYVVVDGFEGTESTYDISVSCATTGWEDCGNSSDDDGDGLVDCDDPECWGIGACSAEVDCSNGDDDDLDGAVDCFDSDCSADIDCQPGKGYWELFERGGAAFDLEDMRLDFTADASNVQGYSWAVSAQNTWIDAPGSGNTTQVLTLDSDINEDIVLPFAFPFQGTDATTIHVVDNGYVSLVDEYGWMPGPNGWNVYQFARIGPLWTDLDPAGGGTVTYDTFSDHVTITWDGVMVANTGTVGNQFQLLLWQNGDVTMVWLTVDAVANQPTWTAGYVVVLGAEVGQPPTETNFN